MAKPSMKNNPAAIGDEGWTWLFNSTRWHYFRGGRSLCGKFLLLSRSGLQLGSDDSRDNCAACRRKLEAERRRIARRQMEIERQLNLQAGICEVCRQHTPVGEQLCGCNKCGRLFGLCCNSGDPDLCVECV